MEYAYTHIMNEFFISFVTDLYINLLQTQIRIVTGSSLPNMKQVC
jgi:hypothetical protein